MINATIRKYIQDIAVACAALPFLKKLDMNDMAGLVSLVKESITV